MGHQSGCAHLEVCSQHQPGLCAPCDRGPPDACSRAAIHADDLVAVRAAESIPPARRRPFSCPGHPWPGAQCGYLADCVSPPICISGALHRAQGQCLVDTRCCNHTSLPSSPVRHGAAAGPGAKHPRSPSSSPATPAPASSARLRLRGGRLRGRHSSDLRSAGAGAAQHSQDFAAHSQAVPLSLQAGARTVAHSARGSRCLQRPGGSSAARSAG